MEAKVHDGMVNIDSDKISYSNIRGMYKGGLCDGSGLQVGEEMSKERMEKIQAICDSIAKKLYELDDELST